MPKNGLLIFWGYFGFPPSMWGPSDQHSESPSHEPHMSILAEILCPAGPSKRNANASSGKWLMQIMLHKLWNTSLEKVISSFVPIDNCRKVLTHIWNIDCPIWGDSQLGIYSHPWTGVVHWDLRLIKCQYQGLLTEEQGKKN